MHAGTGGWCRAKMNPDPEAQCYRRQADVGYCRQPKVDVVRVPEVQAGCLKGKGRDENLFLWFSGFPVGRAQTTAWRPEGRGSQRTLAYWFLIFRPLAPQDRWKPPGMAELAGHLGRKAQMWN